MGFVRKAGAAVSAAALVVVGLVAGPAPAHPPAGAHPHTVTWDQYSLMVDGRRTPVWSGEFHPFRLPSPSLWNDVLEKMKAEGYTAVSLYFDWGYHSPAPGAYDFTGVRDMDRVLDDAARIGLYVIARPGPYINGEVDAGGFPGWLTTQAGRARTNAPDYLAATDEWQSQIDAVVARHQLTNGTGTVLAYQIENELASTSSAERDYLDHLDAKAKADGITVPIFTNDKGRNGYWVPAGSTVPGTVPGPVDLYSFDGYPGGTCHTDGTVGGPSAAPDWGIWGPGGAKGGASASDTSPGFTAEFGGGWFDYWGSVGTYPCTAVRQGPGYERVFYETNIANRLTMQNFYMTFGGTSWGWLPAPVVYTSYDYGAAIDEARQLRPKATAMRPIGYFLQSVTPILRVDAGTPVTPSNPKIKVYHDVNAQTGTQFFIASHNPSSATTDDAFTFPISTPDGDYTLSSRLNGQDAKTLVADYDLGDAAHLVYSTSEIETLFPRDGGELALLYGRDGEPGQTVLRYRDAPTVRVLAGTVDSAYDAATGDLTLNYTHTGLAQVSVTGGGRPPLLLLLADQSTADTLWRQDTAAGTVLERGPELVRAAQAHGGTLALTGDTSTAQPLEIWAPAGVHAVTWNGARTPVRRSASGTLIARDDLPGPAPVKLPDLSKATWHYAAESPEAQPGFDDSAWAVADKTTTNSTTKPPAGAPVLTADDYGFHHGDVWYRGSYTVTGTGPATVSLRYGGGGAGLLQAWLDGTYLGQNELPNAVASPPTTGTATFDVPAGLATPGTHELSVMVRDDGHNEDGGVNDAQKEGRGLISAGFADPAGAPLALAPIWKVQGNQGGEQITDTVRGAVNNGGLYGERAGWYLPGYPDAGWSTRTVPDTASAAGTAWYRTAFSVNVPAADDASLGLTIGDPAVPQSPTAHYRALIFVNGWNLGQYVSDAGPQHTFVIPNGVLNPHGANTVALAVTADGAPASALESVALTNLGTVRGGVPVAMDFSPGYAPPSPRLPDRVRAVAGTPVTETATVTVPADARGAALTATLDWGDGSVSAGVPVTGGTVTATHTYARPGTHRVTVRLDDAYGSGRLASATGTVRVSPHR
ncbi:beta-galactosidase [Rugosimonospora africana]|uniref:beta-galactosidase n=1 Tax=Rugosimonospora africana TaxID=556532 RepID=A0A8J3VRA8_9ACTN|nr:beta-galactosidase [Rugosimonospora africana]GIH15356.1 beta-galactosidase [Rugosimonospora africana]